MARPRKNSTESDTKTVDIADFDNFMSTLDESAESLRETGRDSEWLSLGIVAANIALSGHPSKGVPFNTIINLEGLSDSGKSLLAQTACREAQKKYQQNARILYITSERGLAMNRMESMGLFVRTKPKDFTKPNVDNYEDSTNDPRASTFFTRQTTDMTALADKIIPPFLTNAKNHPEMKFILVIDSLSMLVTDHEKNTEFSKADPARAKDIRKFLRLINDGVRDNVIVMIIHHQTMRMSINGMPLATKQGSHDKDIAGGTSVKFVPDIRLEVNYAGKETIGADDSKEIVGQRTSLKVVKSRFGKPMIEARLVIDHNVGFTQLGGLADQLEQIGLINEVSKGYYTCEAILGPVKYRYRDLIETLEKPENINTLVEAIVKNMKVQNFDDGGSTDTKEEVKELEIPE